MQPDQKPTNDIKNFWNENPVGSNFVDYQSGKEFYEMYDNFRYRTEKHILDELDRIDFKDKKVLEIGLGQGADSMQIINRGGIYYGIDLTEESVRRLKERFALFEKSYIEIQVANASIIPYCDNFFDIVYTHGVIHHSPDIEKIVDEMHRVLKPEGKAITMLYHKNSINYYLSISILRRIGLLLLLAFPFLTKLVSKLTAESIERINKHKENFKKVGWEYLKMNNFVHKSTDGPDNVWATVWTDSSSQKLFKPFGNITTKVHFLNERHLLGLQKILPTSIKEKLARRFGWHLWIFADK
jgi:ubiquinone/menaquinone biosynthesis C-methylase UbiE